MNKPKIRFKGFEGEWKDSMLSDFSYSICSGRDTAHKGIYPLYGSTGIIGTTNKPSYNGAMLLVARVGANAGKLQIINEECGVSDNTLIIKPNGNISVSWLYYYLLHCNLNHLVYGSGQPLITGYMLKRIPILLGSKKECDEIASYFTSLDAQIAASTSRLSSLKQIKAASLLNMFPQKGETVPRVRFKEFQGEWKEKALGDVVDDFKYGINAAAVSYDGENKYLRITDIDEESRAFIKDELTSPDVDLSSCNEYIMQEGDIVIARTGASVGKSYIYHPIDGKVYFAGFLIRARVNKKVDREFVYLNTLTDGFKKYIRFVSQRSGQPGVNAEELKSYLMNLPASLPEQRAIASFFTAIDAQITLHRERLEKLKQIKAACLEKMFA